MSLQSEKIKLKDWRKPANIVTLIRLALSWIPAVIILNSPKESGWWWVAAIVFALVAATDMLDGHLARTKDKITGRDGTTKLGKFLDPLVDKILVAMTLLALCLVTPILWLPTGFIALREVWVALVLRKPAQKAGGVIAAVWSGKVKMAAQCAMIVILMIPGGDVWSVIQFCIQLFSGIAVGDVTTWSWIQFIAVLVAMYTTGWSWIDYQRRFGGKE